MRSYIRKRGSVYWTDFTIRGRRTRIRIGRVTKGYAHRFARELRAKMLLDIRTEGVGSTTINLSGFSEDTLPN
jgi:hypothetical protein